MQASPKMFLSDNRRVRQTESYRLFSTLGRGPHEQPHIFNYSKLFVLNDEELAGLGAVTTRVKQACNMILLPVTGELDFSGPDGQVSRINIGEMKVITLPANSVIVLSNPLADEVINYLLICIEAEKDMDLSALYTFDLDTDQNRLIPMCEPLTTFCINIGRFKGRNEGVYHPRNKSSSLFSFVIGGAFEFENRLLQPRDGLAIGNIEEADFEALSEGALLLLIEIFNPG